MRSTPLRWLGHLGLVGILAAAYTNSRPPSQVVDVAEPPPALERPVATSEPFVPLDATAVPQSPATPSSNNEPYRPVWPTPATPLARFDNWVQSLRPTALLSGPTEQALRFTELPPQSYLKVLEERAGWLLVVYGGDGLSRAPGNAWVRAGDVAPASSVPRWLKNHRVTALWSSPEETAASYTDLPQWSFLELMGQQRNGRLLVRYSGDGRYRLPGQAWVDAKDVGPVQPPQEYQLPRAYPVSAGPDVLRVQVPYRSQLDGSPWAQANCGPTTLGMALEALGTPISSAQLRQEVLDAQQLWGDYVGVYMEALAEVAAAHQAQVLDLYQGGQLKRWSVGDIQAHVRAGHPVIVQVRFRALPGRADSPYYGDHYIVVTGLVGDGFLYNDSINTDGVGFDRLVTAQEMDEAMNASDGDYAHAAFALARS